MTEIGLLMTGVLGSIQPNLPHLPQQQPFQWEDGEQKLIKSQPNRLVIAAQITPPEFMSAEANYQSTKIALALRRDKIARTVKQKQLSQISLKAANAQDQPRTSKEDVKLLARYQKFNRQPMPILSFGSSGVAVRVLQKLLISNGYGIGVDGRFGPLTETAVRAFQNQRRLSVDGVVGQRTWLALTIRN
ncbi:peptidoglycan-binding domain-containing protein [Richelia sinica]|uniref:peptidoglycan-binding domain-containing protein n=1 Tax=Richelia sinica TaxID=1357545 RepID=UPI0016860544|nr:peptidoglycan-binding domain-containing protein [Richelia sinica]MBD2666358.1 peptidoglycan-binding protein [Richelia sinica FACHB-800]